LVKNNLLNSCSSCPRFYNIWVNIGNVLLLNHSRENSLCYTSDFWRFYDVFMTFHPLYNWCPAQNSLQQKYVFRATRHFRYPKTRHVFTPHLSKNKQCWNIYYTLIHVTYYYIGWKNKFWLTRCRDGAQYNSGGDT